MSETEAEPTGAAAPEGDTQDVALMIHGQYIKDFSFEVPGAPQIFMEQIPGQPNVDLGLDVQVHGLTDETFEVVLDVKADCKLPDGKTAYICELKYGGLVSVNLPEEQRAPVLFIEVARLLFPFARAVLADVSRDGGFAPLILGPVDFAQIFHQNVENIQKTEG